MGWRELGLEMSMDSQGRGSGVSPRWGSARALGRQEGERLKVILICRLMLGWV